MERVFSGTGVLRGHGFRRECKYRPVSENRVKFDSRRLQTSLSSGLPLSSESFVWASQVRSLGLPLSSASFVWASQVRSLGLPLSSASFVWASHVHAKFVSPKLREEGIEPDHSVGGPSLLTPNPRIPQDAGGFGVSGRSSGTHRLGPSRLRRQFRAPPDASANPVRIPQLEARYNTPIGQVRAAPQPVRDPVGVPSGDRRC
jgi:hypothetical protein